ncbi:hypothetical protein [Anaerophaga thermohalophila]|uniref:hypothetical protein n=1 Tax=Anaerophaga thermohalophila TaxID=177400 RepID=UPI0002D9E52D|nr:hypothetical protein [Anaerophaga thermohalophila]
MGEELRDELKNRFDNCYGKHPPIIVPGILSDIEGIMKKIQKKFAEKKKMLLLCE